jgi:putative oxidoreductase
MRTNSASPDPATNWAVRVSVAVVFSLTGIDKVAPISAVYWVHTFDLIGLGQWFRYFTCAMEVIGGVLFLVPPATVIGLIMLTATMLGAIVVHIFLFHHPLDALFPAAYLLGVILGFRKLSSGSDPYPRGEYRTPSVKR